MQFSSAGAAVVVPKDAATLVLLRTRGAGNPGASGVEVFCVQRHKDSAFMGGWIVFPGGKIDPKDREGAWSDRALDLTTPLCARAWFGADEVTARAVAVAACRETLEEAAMLPTAGQALPHEALLALRTRLAAGESLSALLVSAHARLDLEALHPFARWITPEAETRRFDTRFFLAVAGQGHRGAHDEHETTASFWATPADVLARFDAGTVQLAPPTHRTLTLLAGLARAEDAPAFAAASCLDPICPRLVRKSLGGVEVQALVLPGDPEHDVPAPRVAGPSRFILHGTRWLPAT